MNRDYRVRLDAFEGPLDLLLFLIRRAEVEVTDIPIAVITDQYLAYLHEIDAIDIERAGEFLVLAATLMEIKSRCLAPAPEVEGPGEGSPTGGGAPAATDPRFKLVRQLLEYKKFRDAAAALERRRAQWESRFPIGHAALDGDDLARAVEGIGGVDIEDVDATDLIEAFARILDTVDFNRVGEHHVLVDDTPIELYAQDILSRLRALAGDAAAGAEGGATEPGEVQALGPADENGRGMDLTTIFQGRPRAEVIGLFLAMLELVRQRRVIVRQDKTLGRITIGLADAGPDAQLPEPSPSAAGEEGPLHEAIPRRRRMAKAASTEPGPTPAEGAVT